MTRRTFRGAATRPHAAFLDPVGYNIPVGCGGGQVRPGDAIIGDQDGVVLVPAERLEDIIVQAQDLEVLEKEQERAIAEGKPVEELNKILRRKKQRE
jgi:3-hexulose-6-phosphate synthase/6-phospho-3-hexuloisomerase